MEKVLCLLNECSGAKGTVTSMTKRCDHRVYVYREPSSLCRMASELCLAHCVV